MGLAEKRAGNLLREAKDQAADIVGLAQKRAGELVEESKVSAKEEGERIVSAARSEIDREVQKAKEGLRQQVADLAIDAAAQILKQEVDRNKHKQIIDNLGQALGNK
jgi:F-type H+-transporting ATPase subunit b